jgi:hypothetical protein
LDKLDRRPDFLAGVRFAEQFLRNRAFAASPAAPEPALPDASIAEAFLHAAPEPLLARVVAGEDTARLDWIERNVWRSAIRVEQHSLIGQA